MESSRDPKEGRDNTPAVAYGVTFGIVLGSVVFALTEDPLWIGIGIPFGAALGIAVRAVLQADRRHERLR